MDCETLGRIVRDAWSAWARENPVRCLHCCGSGWVLPYCERCGDSGDDHECPNARPCDECSCTGAVPRRDWIEPWEEAPAAQHAVECFIGEAVASVTREACAALCERVAHELETVPMGAIRDAVARRDLAVSELRRAAERIRG